MNPNLNANTEANELDALLASITDDEAPTPPTEIIEDEAAPVGTADIEAAVAQADAETPPAETVETPATEKKAKTPDPEKEKARAEAKAKKEAEKAAAKAKRDEEKAARAAEKAKKEAEKAAKPKRIFFGANKIGRLTHEMGADRLNEFSVLTIADAGLEGEALAKRQKEVQDMIAGMAQKVKNRATYLFLFMHKGGKLNEVMRRVFFVLHRDGKIKTGDSGNMTAELLAKPYDLKTARATGNNTVSLLKQLQVLVPGTEKGEYVGNPDSLVLAKVNEQLGYTKSAA